MEKRRAGAQDWHGAIIHMRLNLALDGDGPERRERSERLAYAYFRARKLPEAIETYRSALALDPISPVGCANLGRALHLAGGDLTEAEYYLREACRLQPDNVWAFSWLGLLLADTGRVDEGEHQARQALADNDEHSVLLYHLAQILARFPDHRRDKLQEALNTCTLAGTGIDLVKELRRRLGHSNAVPPDPRPSTD